MSGVICKKCNGSRKLICNYCSGSGLTRNSLSKIPKCPFCCNGTNICHFCKGTGKQKK